MILDRQGMVRSPDRRWVIARRRAEGQYN